jgi:hypothetical protein
MIEERYTLAFYNELEKAGFDYKTLKRLGMSKKQIFRLAEIRNRIESEVLKRTRRGRPKHVFERIPPKMVRTREIFRRGFKTIKGMGPTGYAISKVLERPRKRAIAGGVVGGIIGLPAPPPIPAMMVLAPGLAAATELPRILKIRGKRKVDIARRAVPSKFVKGIIKGLRRGA